MVFAIFLSSCKKSSTGNSTETPTTKPKYLTQIISVETGPAFLGSHVTTSNIYYTYDSKKRLSTVKNSDNSLITYVYKDDGNLFSTTRTNANGTMQGYNEFTYEGGKLTSYTSKGYRNNAVTSETTYTYVYNGDRATELHFDVYYQLFTYDSNGNLTKIFNHGQPDYSIVYSYDNKKNKFINSPFKYPVPGDNERLSPNNRTTSTTEGLSQNILTTNTYVYDSDGYPIAGTQNTDYVNSSSYKYTYIYSTLE
jgi:uncharacterized lipoprotein YehR (DUF1307 family)